LSQKYITNKKPFESTVEENRMWQCCVDRKGRRKHDYPRRVLAEAAIRDLEEKGKVKGKAKVYRCLFNPDVFHITTKKANRRLDDTTCEYMLKNLKYRLAKTEAAIEALKEKVEGMTSATPLDEIRQAKMDWHNLSKDKERLPKLIKSYEDFLLYGRPLELDQL
jgi:hypothetical protein